MPINKDFRYDFSNLICDFDDTIFDTFHCVCERFDLLRLKYPLEETNAFLARLLVDNEERERFILNDPKRKNFFDEYGPLRKKTFAKPIGEVKKHLEKLSSVGINLGIFTRRDLFRVKNLLDRARIEKEMFNLGIIASDNYPYPKPEPYFLSQFGKKTIYVGDSIEDYEISLKARVEFAAVCTGINQKGDFLERGLKLQSIFPDINEFIITTWNF